MVDFSKLAEQRIIEAQKRGELDDLPGAGQPIAPAEDAAVPADLRMAYKILKNHGMLPREAILLKQIDEARQRVESASNDDIKAYELEILEELCLEYNMLKPRPSELEATSLSSTTDK